MAFAGRSTETDTGPEEHDTALGKPMSAGILDTSQLVALVTIAASSVDPPKSLKLEGVALSPEITGARLVAPDACVVAAVEPNMPKTTTEANIAASRADGPRVQPFDFDTAPPLRRPRPEPLTR